MINELVKYIDGVVQDNARKNEIIAWVQTTGKKHMKSQTEAEHIVDYFASSAAPSRLLKMSYADAKRKTEAWSKANQKKGRNLEDGPEDVRIIHDFLDGTKIVELLTSNALKREGFLMCHCVGSYSINPGQRIYSYRDSKNVPHATFEVRTDSEQIIQIKGKGNGSIHPRYVHPILTFLQTIGFNIRPHDMKNLGYYHVSQELMPVIQRMNLESQMIMIKGEAYAY